MSRVHCMASGTPPYPPPPRPFRTRSVAAADWFRIHPFDAATGLYGPTQFNHSKRSNARFSPLVYRGKVVPTLYAAQTPRGAIAEILLHDVPTPSAGYLHDWEKDQSSNLHLSQISLSKLQLVNLTSTGLRSAGLAVADLFESEKPDYPRTREWALHIWKTLPEAQGLQWMSVRDNSCAVAMLFEDRIATSDVQNAHNSQPVSHFESEVMQLLDDLGAAMGGT